MMQSDKNKDSQSLDCKQMDELDEMNFTEYEERPINTEFSQSQEEILRTFYHGKRGREEEEDGWETVSKGKKTKEGKIELYISCREKLPKQFALAKIFKNMNILNIKAIKYLSPYKIRLQLDSDLCVEKLTASEELIEKGWKFQRPFQVDLSYGTIRDVDLDLSEKEIQESILCPSPAILESAHRLQRRDFDGKWIPSETVRLCFKGSYLPPYVNVDNVRIKVDPFVFPVSQCSNCWKLGHTAKRCPSNKIICPKCGNNHSNCETLVFKCVNCGGDHMSLSRSCPEYLREKRIRQIMSEFNCTYRKARSMCVIESPKKEYNIADFSSSLGNNNKKSDPVCDEKDIFEDSKTTFSETMHEKVSHTPTYASKVKVKAEVHRENRKPKRKESIYELYEEKGNIEDHNFETKEASKDRVTLSELIIRLKEIIFLRGITIQSKIYRAIKCLAEWFILVVTENIASWPVLKNILDLFNG